MVMLALRLLFLGRWPWVGAGPAMGGHGCVRGLVVRVRFCPTCPAGWAVWFCVARVGILGVDGKRQDTVCSFVGHIITTTLNRSFIYTRGQGLGYI